MIVKSTCGRTPSQASTATDSVEPELTADRTIRAAGTSPVVTRPMSLAARLAAQYPAGCANSAELQPTAALTLRAHEEGSQAQIYPLQILWLTATDVPEDPFGYFLASQTQDFVANPGGSQGNLCLGAPSAGSPRTS